MSVARVLAGGDWMLREARAQQADFGRRRRPRSWTTCGPGTWCWPTSKSSCRTGTPFDKRYTITPGSSPEVARDLAPFSIGAVSLANNHTMDYGVEALQDTIDVVEACGVATFGAGASCATPSAHVYWSSMVCGSGWSACRARCRQALPQPTAPGGVAPIRVITQLEMDPGLALEQPGSAPLMHTRLVEADVDRAQAAVRAARDEADVVLIMMHWGVPPSIATFYGFYLAEYQQPLGRALIDAGADVIIGHHPHVLHAVETYRGRADRVQPGEHGVRGAARLHVRSRPPARPRSGKRRCARRATAPAAADTGRHAAARQSARSRCDPGRVGRRFAQAGHHVEYPTTGTTGCHVG